MKMRMLPVALLIVSGLFLLGAKAVDQMTPPKMAGTGWKEASSTKNFRVYTRPTKGGVGQVLMVGILQATPKECFDIVTNYDNFSKIMPYVKFSHLHHTEVINKNKTIHYAFFYVDAPMVSPRYYTLALADEKDANGEKGAYMSKWSLVKSGPYYETPESPEIKQLSKGKLRKGVETASNQGYWLFQPLPDGKGTKVSYMVLTNPGGSIPHWIANKANTVALPKLWAALNKALIHGS